MLNTNATIDADGVIAAEAPAKSKAKALKKPAAKKTAAKKATKKPVAKKAAVKKAPAKKAAAKKTTVKAETEAKPARKKAPAKKAAAAKSPLYLAKDTYKALINGLMDQGLEHADAVETLKVGLREANGIPVPPALRHSAAMADAAAATAPANESMVAEAA